MGFLDNVLNKSVPQGSSPAKPLLLALRRPTGFRSLDTHGVRRPDTSFRLSPVLTEAAWRTRWTARKVPAERSWRRCGGIMGRQQAKSADLAWPSRFGARVRRFIKGLGPKDSYLRTRTDGATVASPGLHRQANAAGSPSNA